MSQPVEARLRRTGYPTAAGVMLIVAASWLIVIHSLNIFTYYPRQFIWLEAPYFLGLIMLDILVVAGGVLALTRTRLLFAAFGASILVPESLSFMISLAAYISLGENLTYSLSSVLNTIVTPVTLVLSALSLIFLAKSKPEFS